MGVWLLLSQPGLRSSVKLHKHRLAYKYSTQTNNLSVALIPLLPDTSNGSVEYFNINTSRQLRLEPEKSYGNTKYYSMVKRRLFDRKFTMKDEMFDTLQELFQNSTVTVSRGGKMSVSLVAITVQ